MEGYGHLKLLTKTDLCDQLVLGLGLLNRVIDHICGPPVVYEIDIGQRRIFPGKPNVVVGGIVQ